VDEEICLKIKLARGLSLFKMNLTVRLNKILRTGDEIAQIVFGVLLRGGNWNNGVNAGAFTLNLNWDTANQNNNVGFRCARYTLLYFYLTWPE
jgi:hypothetical protein